MTRKNKSIERVKDGVGVMMKKTRKVVNDRLDSMEETLKHGVDDVGRRYFSKLAQLQARVDGAKGAAREQIGEVKSSLQVNYLQARKKLLPLQRDARKYVQANPARSVLIATGVGLLFGLAARRRAATP